MPQYPPTRALAPLVVYGVGSRRQPGRARVDVERCDQTAPCGAFIQHTAARVAVQPCAGVTTHDRRHVDVDGVSRAHTDQVLVVVLVKHLLVCDSIRTEEEEYHMYVKLRTVVKVI